MLVRLSIQNYVLIKKLELQPSDNLNIITGETGAGKSILLGAVGLLLGNRADVKTLLNKDKKCIIEGVFNVEGYHLESLFEEEELDYEQSAIFRREITPLGKSRAFINDTPVRLETLKNIGKFLVDIHSQHETLLLGDAGFQLKVVDAFADNNELLTHYKNRFFTYREAEKSHGNLIAEAGGLRKEYDFFKFQHDELAKMDFQAGEQDLLEEELNVLENTEEFKLNLAQVDTLLSESDFSVLNSLNEIKGCISRLAGFSSKYSDMLGQLETILIDLKEIGRDIGNDQEQLEFNPGRVEEINARLDILYRLQKKHGIPDIEGLLALQNDLSRKIEMVVNLDDEIQQALDKKNKAFDELMDVAQKLSASREKVMKGISDSVEGLLLDLSLPDARLVIESVQGTPRIDGCDNIVFKFSANKGIAPEELGKVASGGEMSRLMFCFKYLLAGKTSLPTIIFDEIDTGVSGEIALKLGKMMKEMGRNHQVFTITHLPQIAAKGDSHYFVYKSLDVDSVASEIRLLEDNERLKEIAKMIAGENPSGSAYESARELVNQ